MCMPYHIPQYSSPLGRGAGETPQVSRACHLSPPQGLLCCPAVGAKGQPSRKPASKASHADRRCTLHAHAFTLLYLPTNAHIAKIAALYHNKSHPLFTPPIAPIHLREMSRTLPVHVLQVPTSTVTLSHQQSHARPAIVQLAIIQPPAAARPVDPRATAHSTRVKQQLYHRTSPYTCTRSPAYA
jgi:hypothetical protein